MKSEMLLWIRLCVTKLMKYVINEVKWNTKKSEESLKVQRLLKVRECFRKIILEGSFCRQYSSNFKQIFVPS